MAGAAGVVGGESEQPPSKPVQPLAQPLPRASPRPPAPRPQPVAEESLPGTRDWQLTRLGSPEAVEGFAESTAVVPGEPLVLYLSSLDRTVRVEAFRLGWYAGDGARLVWAKEEVGTPRQPAPDVVSPTNTVVPRWEPTVRIDTAGWPEGAYLVRLTAVHGQRYIPVVLRSTQAAGKILLVHATTTWQAYNTWGGYSLYQGPDGPQDYANRSRIVSSHRPFAYDGAGRFREFEQSVVTLAGRLGLPVAYTTTEYASADPKLLAGAAAIVSLGHDEYWTPQLRQNVTAARDAGVNIAFLGANACFRRIRFASDARVICYKTDYMSDPLYGVRNALVTNDFRDDPAPDPECSLTGTYYESFPTAGTLRVLTPDCWLLRGTGATRATRYGNLIGPEYDRVNPVVPLPRPLQVIAHSPIICKGVRTFSDAAYYTRPSGAGVFNAGTMHWTRALLRSDPAIPADSARFATRVTTNLLTAFAAGPAAERFPAQDNLDAVHPWVGDPTVAGVNLW